MMYSPRSVSTGVMPFLSRCSLSAISSATIDLPLVTILAPTERQISSTAARASAASRAQSTRPARRDDVLIVEFEIEIEMGERVILDRAALLAQLLEFGQPLDRLPAAQRK